MLTEELRASLLRRLAAMHGFWRLAVADLTLAHVNHHERAEVLPLAFSLVHCVSSEDATASRLLDAGPVLWDSYAARVLAAGERPVRGSAIDEAERVRIADMDAWREYQERVHARTEDALARIRLERLAAPLFDGGRPESLRGSFLALLVPEGPIRVFDSLEATVYQHGIRHFGEIEHARALVGLRGLS